MNKIDFRDPMELPFTKFTKTDRREVIRKIYFNESTMDQFYEYLFENR